MRCNAMRCDARDARRYDAARRDERFLFCLSVATWRDERFFFFASHSVASNSGLELVGVAPGSEAWGALAGHPRVRVRVKDPVGGTR